MRWVANPSEPNGGHYEDLQGNRLPDNPWEGLPKYVSPGGAQPAAPAAPAAPAIPPAVQSILSSLESSHGPRVGSGYLVEKFDSLGSPVKGSKPPLTKYTFTDGSTIEINPLGEVGELKEKAAKATDKPVSPGQDWLTIYDTEGRPKMRIDPSSQKSFTIDQPTPETPSQAALNQQKLAAGTLELADNAALNAEKRANEAAGKGYMSNDDAAKLANLQATQGLNRDEFDQKKREFEVNSRQEDDKFRLAAEKFADDKLTSASDRARTTAQTGYIGAQTGTEVAQTGLTQQQGVTEAERPELIKAQAAQARAGVGETQATTAYTQARTETENKTRDASIQRLMGQYGVDQATAAKIWQDMQQVTPVAAPADSPFIATRDPATQQIRYEPNQNYRPKTAAEVAQQAGMLQQRATAERDRLAAKISATYTAEQAAQEFDGWWNQNVEPQKVAIAAQQQDIALERQKTQEELRRGNLATAQAAGTQAISAYQAQAKNRVGPGFAKVANQLAQSFANPNAPMPEMDVASAVTYKGQDLNKLAEQATARALASISPSAAMAAGGQPNQLPQNIDVPGMLNRTNYSFNGLAGGPPPGMPAAAQPNYGPVNMTGLGYVPPQPDVYPVQGMYPGIPPQPNVTPEMLAMFSGNYNPYQQ